MSFIDKVRILGWSAHYEGADFTLFRAFIKLFSFFGGNGTSNAVFLRSSENRFDSRFHVHTSGVTSPEQLDLPEKLQNHAVEYCSTSANRFGWLLSKLEIEYSKYAFVDFGSGKGRVLLMASEFPFQKVVGVELSQDLHKIALNNFQTFRGNRVCKELLSIRCDVTKFLLPTEPLVVYFFNPFSGEILEKVLKNLLSSLKVQPRHVVLIYHNPLHVDVIRRYRHFKEITEDFQLADDWAVFETDSLPVGKSE